MKYRLLLFTAILISGSILLSGCTKKNVQPATLVGKWQLASYTTSIYSNSNLLSASTQNDFSTSEYIIFNTDGTGTASSEREELEDLENDFNFSYSHPNLTLVQYQKEGGTTVTTSYIIDNLGVSALTMHTEGTYTYNEAEYKKIETFTFQKVE